MSEEAKNITAPRVERIEGILLKDPVLKEKLTGGKKHPVKTRDGKEKLFHKESVDVVMAIHEANQDAYTINKDGVLKIARERLGAAIAVPSESSAAAAPKPSTEEKPKNGGTPTAVISGSQHLLSVVTLLLGAKSIADIHDKGAGHEGRDTRLSSLIDEFTKAHYSGAPAA